MVRYSPLYSILLICVHSSEICIAYTDTKAKTDDRQMYLHTIYRFNCNCSNCTSEEGAKINRRKMEDLNGKVCKNADPIIESTNGAISDMQEFQKKREWSIMKDSIDGWLARKLLPDHNMLADYTLTVFKGLTFCFAI